MNQLLKWLQMFNKLISNNNHLIIMIDWLIISALINLLIQRCVCGRTSSDVCGHLFNCVSDFLHVWETSCEVYSKCNVVVLLWKNDEYTHTQIRSDRLVVFRNMYVADIIWFNTYACVNKHINDAWTHTHTHTSGSAGSLASSVWHGASRSVQIIHGWQRLW